MRNLVRGGVAVGVIAAAAFTWGVNPPQANAEPECLWTSNDYNRDGVTDVAIGAPGANNGVGAVDVRVSENDGGTQTYRVAPPQGRAGDQFGTAIAEVAATDGEFTQERCSLLVVGAPGRDVGDNADAGAIYVYAFVNPDQGFQLVNSYTLDSPGVPGTARAGARFGAALAAPYHESWDQLQTPLYAGAPGYAVGGAKGAGAFLRLTFTEDQDQAVDTGAIMTQGSGGIPGSAEAGDAFGSALATVDGGVFVGAPREDVGSAVDAGGFVRWRERDTADARFFTQNTTGVPGTAEAGDLFGSAIYAAGETTAPGYGHYVMVGAPGEAIGSVRGAGSAVRFDYNGDIWLKETKGFSQDTTGVSGTAETNDHFGSSFSAYGPANLVVGVPGEDVGTIKDAGLVESLDGQSWQQDGAGVPGKAEAGDRFGATMSNVLLPQQPTDDGWLSLVLIGVPGEDGGVGSVVKGLPGGSGTTAEWKQQSGAVGDHYGAAIGKTN